MTDNSQSQPQQKQQKQQKQISTYDDLSTEIANQINNIRTNPASYIPIIKDILNGSFNDKKNEKIVTKKNKTRVLLEEGKSALSEALEFLSKTEPVNALETVTHLSSAASDHVVDIGSAGIYSHTGSGSGSGSTVVSRVEKYCNWDFGLAENIVFNEYDAVETVVAFLVDDGNTERNQRSNLFNKDFKYLGVSTGDHDSESGRSVVCVFAANIRDIKADPLVIEDDTNNTYTNKEKTDNDGNSNSNSNVNTLSDLLPKRTVTESLKNPMQEVDKDAPDDAVSVSYSSKTVVYKEKELKVSQKSYTMKNGGTHIVEVIYDN